MKSNDMNWTGAQTLADLKALMVAALAGAVLALMLGMLALTLLVLTSPA